MQRKLPGIDTPAATEAKILHATAFLEFKKHVERLAREGSDLAAYTCWMHGVEVCHSPYVMATGTGSDLFPSGPPTPAVASECTRPRRRRNTQLCWRLPSQCQPAVRKGLATLQVPGIPAFIAVGRREH